MQSGKIPLSCKRSMMRGVGCHSQGYDEAGTVRVRFVRAGHIGGGGGAIRKRGWA